MTAPAASLRDTSLAALVVYASTTNVAAGQFTVLAPYATNSAIQTRQLASLIVYTTLVFTKQINVSHLAALVPYRIENMTSPHVSQAAVIVVYTGETYGNTRSRCWTFVLDGHTFFVLDLGVEGTFLYDIDTKQWCEFATDGYAGWNMHFGTMWGEGRIAGGDALNGFVWELDPDLTTDEGFRDLTHIVTGSLTTRTRVAKAVERFNLAGSIGQQTSPDGATVSLRWSDNQGATWSDTFTLALDPTNPDQELAWRSLGSFKAPGRVFEISDIGGMLRIDGADAGINNYDEDGTPGQ